MRIPVFDTEEEVIAYHTNMYYEQVGEDPTIRVDEVRHMEIINHIDGRYKKALKYVEPGSDTDPMDYAKYENSFLENIDYLTRVFAKKKEQQERSEAKRRLFFPQQ